MINENNFTEDDLLKAFDDMPENKNKTTRIYIGIKTYKRFMKWLNGKAKN